MLYTVFVLVAPKCFDHRIWPFSGSYKVYTRVLDMLQIVKRIKRQKHIKLVIQYFQCEREVSCDLILVNDQLDALFFNVFISTPLHVSSSKCLSSGGPTCINTPSGVTHSGSKRV